MRPPLPEWRPATQTAKPSPSDRFTHFTQYRDDALAVVVRHHIGGGNLRAALTATEGFSNSSRKAATLLRTAAAVGRPQGGRGSVVAEFGTPGKQHATQ